MHYNANEPECVDSSPDRSYEGCENRGHSGRWRELGNSHVPAGPSIEQENMEGSETSMAGNSHRMLIARSLPRDTTPPTPVATPILVDDVSTQMNSGGTISTGTSVGHEAAAFFEQLPYSEESHPEAQENVYGAERAQAMPTDADPGDTVDSRVSALDEATSLLYCVADEPRRGLEAISQGPRSHRPSQTPSEEGGESVVAGDEDGRSTSDSSSRESMATAGIPIVGAGDVSTRTSLEEVVSSGASVERAAEASLAPSPSPEYFRRAALENVDGAEGAQAMQTGAERENAEHSDVSATTSLMDMAANTPERAAEEHEQRLGGSGAHVDTDHPKVPQGSSGGWRELIPKALKTIAKRARRAALQVASGAKKVREKCAKFGTKLAVQHRHEDRSFMALS
uniref:Transcriptional repressor rco-1 n=1 Tax=Ganoderma boninense TaxID=34458 RepID=A0A5K1K5X9_9APHY|nr:Transcriptional repressor rco-1 [Ganoderma boninense]